MFPTMFKIPFLPEWLADIRSYGVMMMLAFLTGIWLACRRAFRSQANPDIVLNIGFLALICGVLGARAMFVIHYWDTKFANQPNPVMAVFDIRAGGLEFYGGPLLVIPAVIIYLRFVAKVSARWYLDITMPSLAWGLAITRVGCFLNGCCWGAICVDEHDPARSRPALPWAVSFPYGSPAMVQQYEFGQLVLPKELIQILPTGESMPLARDYLEALAADGGKTYTDLEARRNAALAEWQKAAQPGAEQATLKGPRERLTVAENNLRKYYSSTMMGVADRYCRDFGLTPQEMKQLASSYRSKPVHPTQLYETTGAFLLCWVLSWLYYYRQRHGILGAWFLILYSIMRFFLELIRQDNPLDVGGLTISQVIAIVTFLVGLLWLWVVHTKMPLISPRAVAYLPPEDEAKPKAK